MPGERHCTLVSQRGEPIALPSVRHLNGQSGFVIAPFAIDEHHPLLVIGADAVHRCLPREVMAIDGMACHLEAEGLPIMPADREVYHNDFSRFHRTFSAIGMHKLVLARCADVTHGGGINAAALFALACERYPESFVALFSARQCGTWLMATPEILLSCRGERWHTMALAGTMACDATVKQPSWSEKNMEEQALVARYIKTCLDDYSDDVVMTGPYTSRAGHLVHLRTDFSFSLTGSAVVGEVLESLHPTPAVCGVPKHQALRFILENESIDRSYYSGFSGPLNLDGDTSMFVSLRCMRILEDRYRLYAGGGILPQSEESMEWDETAAKMQSMLSII